MNRFNNAFLDLFPVRYLTHTFAMHGIRTTCHRQLNCSAHLNEVFELYFHKFFPTLSEIMMADG